MTEIQVVILAGGLGSRMKRFTQQYAKAMIPVRGIPFIEHQLMLLHRNNISKVLLALGHHAQSVTNHIGDGSSLGMEVEYTIEQDNLLGTAGALRLALDEGKLHDRFIVMYGDSYLPIDYQYIWRFFISKGGDALMTVYRNGDTLDRSNVIWRNDELVLYDKNPQSKQSAEMHHIDYGLSAFSKNLIAQRIEPGEKADLALLQNQLSREGTLTGLEIFDRFYEIGSESGLKDLELYFEQTANRLSRNL